MTALANLSQNAQIPTAGIADKAVTSRKNFLDVQWSGGNNAAYINCTTGTVLQRSPGVALRLDYTPEVNCFWEVVGKIGLITQNVDAMYRGDFNIRCYPAAPGSVETMMSGHQRSAQIRYIGRTMTALFQLDAGVAYSSDLICSSVGGGTWQYYQGPSHLSLFGKAWAR